MIDSLNQPDIPGKAGDQSYLDVAVGAEIDSRPGLVQSGLLLVGTPAERRLALSFLSFRAARPPCVSKRLAGCFAGSWVAVLMCRRALTFVLRCLFDSCQETSTWW